MILPVSPKVGLATKSLCLTSDVIPRVRRINRTNKLVTSIFVSTAQVFLSCFLAKSKFVIKERYQIFGCFKCYSDHATYLYIQLQHICTFNCNIFVHSTATYLYILLQHICTFYCNIFVHSTATCLYTLLRQCSFFSSLA